MRFFFGKEKPKQGQSFIEPMKGAAQTRDSWETRFGASFQKYLPLNPDVYLYNIIREAIPICNAIVKKRTRLVGDFRLDGLGNTSVQNFLDDFYRNIKVGHFGKGFRTFQNQMVDSSFANGFTVGETVLTLNLSGIHSLKVGRSREFRFMKKEGGGLELCQLVEGEFMPIKLENQDLLHYLAFDLRDGHPQGKSIFSSMPFVAEIVTRIMKATDNVIWRFGDPTLYLVYGAGEGEVPDEVKTGVNEYRKQITEAMKARKTGQVVDLAFAHGKGGNILLKVLGSDAKFIDIQIPTRVMLEQIIADSGMSPFMFGLSWSTTERMAREQLEILISEIENERSILDAIIEKVVDTALIFSGFQGAKWKHEWFPINLTDEQVTANARLTNAQAIRQEFELKMMIRDAGFLTDEEVLEWMIEQGMVTADQVKRTGKEKIIAMAQERYHRAKIFDLASMVTGLREAA
jgi:hypothetical protein